MAKRGPGTRVAVQLDDRIALEAIILNRLRRVPENRRQEWLRGLLVQGFRQECRTLQGTAVEERSLPVMAFSPRPEGAMRGSLVNPVTNPKLPQPTAGSAGKPFAVLGKVIG